MQEHGRQDYLTVGQLARKVGTTVRTIQYYDQQGLLPPSAKGPSNQRLYSPEDEDALYRILTLKYLGLPLAEIKERQESLSNIAAFREVLSHTMATLEEDFQSLVKRLSVLRGLLDQTAAASETEWPAYAHMIEAQQEEGAFFWHQLDEIPSAASDDEERADRRKGGMAIAKWHELVADAISLMTDRISPDDPRAKAVALRYGQMKTEGAGSLAQMFALAKNVTPHHGAPGSFDVLQDSVLHFLEDACAAHVDSSEFAHPDGGASSVTADERAGE